MAASQTEVPPPLQDVPTSKEKKYDRQLRLWGAAGQIALEETHILLINNGPGVTGVETLKNLVLPGIGEFSILDSGIVSEADLGVNFFLDDSSLGKFRADETVKLLVELNSDVEGHAIKEVGNTEDRPHTSKYISNSDTSHLKPLSRTTNSSHHTHSSSLPHQSTLPSSQSSRNMPKLSEYRRSIFTQSATIRTSQSSSHLPFQSLKPTQIQQLPQI